MRRFEAATVLLRQTRLGDSDLDGDVDLSDLINFAVNYGQVSGAAWNESDFDYDGDVDLNDLNSLAAYYGAGDMQAFADFAVLANVLELSLFSPAAFSRCRLQGRASFHLRMFRRTFKWSCHA